MAKIDLVKAQMQSLLAAANSKTGKSDTTLTEGVNSLIDGYGSSASGGSGGSGMNVSAGFAGALIGLMISTDSPGVVCPVMSGNAESIETVEV